MKKLVYLFAFVLAGFISCEPDDICLAETPGTPSLIIVFYDNDQPESKKEVPNLQVKGLGLEAEFYSGTTDSIAIPLKINENATDFLLSKTENDILFEESITFKHDSYDRFLSRACGYQKIFTNLSTERTNSIVWIESIEIVTDTISDINNTHVKILH